jgi:transcriptional regulator with GAF, ATPase, and Fis domain
MPDREDESSGNPSLEEIERKTLMSALDKASWNQTRASHMLKISRDLRYRIKKLNLRPTARSLTV